MKSKRQKNVRRKYDDKFKEEIVRRHLDGEPAPQLAEHFGISSTGLIYRWKEQALQKMGDGEGGLSPSRMEAELRELRKKLKRTEQERDILKKALGIFSQPG